MKPTDSSSTPPPPATARPNDATASPAKPAHSHIGERPVGPPWLGSVHHRAQIDLHWLTVALIMAAAGWLFFGWRGPVMVGITGAAAVAAHLVIVGLVRLIARRPSRVPHLHPLNLGLLLGASLPLMQQPWLPIAAGAMVGLLSHVIGRAHRLRLHPVALVLVTVWLLPVVLPGAMRVIGEPVDAVLRPQRLLIGNVGDATAEASIAPWWSPAEYTAPDAIRRIEAGNLFLDHRIDMLGNRESLVQAISSGELVRLEELFIGAHPDAIGAGSRALLIVLGFYLMYRRLAFWQVGATALLTAVAVILVLPWWDSDQQAYTSVLSKMVDLGPAASVTYVSYFLFATPMTLMVLILAPGTAPMSRAGRLIYGALLGGGGIAAMWWIGAPQAALLALLLASLISRPLDALQRSAFVG